MSTRERLVFARYSPNLGQVIKTNPKWKVMRMRMMMTFNFIFGSYIAFLFCVATDIINSSSTSSTSSPSSPSTSSSSIATSSASASTTSSLYNQHHLHYHNHRHHYRHRHCQPHLHHYQHHRHLCRTSSSIYKQ